MSASDGHMLGSALGILLIAVLLFAIMVGMQAEKAYARASLATYMSIQPNAWEPSSYNTTGTAAKGIVDTLGWNATRLKGNVGLGDGSVSAFNRMSNPEVNYSENNFMAGDISEAPWDPGRITALANNGPETKEINTTKNVDTSIDTANGDLKAGGKKVEPANPIITGKPTSSMALNDPYHSILFGRPVDDLLYERPLVITGTDYLRLVGLQMPGGGCLNIGMRTLSYGY